MLSLTRIYKEHELEKFNGQGDPNTHMQGFKYVMELRYGINYIIKAKYLLMILTSSARK